jgi:hypothetical protein
MNIEDYLNYSKKLNLLAEIKIFKKLQKRHIADKHEHGFIYLCKKCNDDVEVILNEFIISENKNHILHQKEKEDDIKLNASVGISPEQCL